MNFLVRVVRLGLIALIGANFSMNAQTAAAAAPSEADSLAVSLSVDKQSVRIGQSPLAILTVQNLSSREVAIHDFMFRVHVEGKGGEPPTTLIQREWTGTLRAGDQALRADEMSVWTISPGFSGLRKIELGYLYYLSTPGEYTVYAQVDDPASHKWLRTNTVTFQVLPLLQSSSGTSTGQSSTTSLSILVEDPTGAVITGACVIVQHWEDTWDHSGRRAVQDAVATIRDQSSFTLPLPPGQYEVFVSAQAFVPIAAIVSVHEGENRRVFNLNVQSGGGVEVLPSHFM